MKDTVKLALTLFIITAISALILAISNNVTAPVIAEANELKTDQAKMELLEDGEEFISVDESLLKELQEKDNRIVECDEGLKNNEVVGYVFKTTTSGYSGDIEFMVGISSEGNLNGIKVLSHDETPGLGESIMKPSFLNSFKDRSIEKELTAVTEPSGKSEVQAITSATITTDAMVGEINNIIKVFNEVINE